MAVLPIARGDSEGGVLMPAPPQTPIHIHFLEPAAMPTSAEAAPVLVPGAANLAAARRLLRIKRLESFL